MDQRGVGAERDVVQKNAVAGQADIDPPLIAAEGCERTQRVRMIEPQVAGEVIASPERDTDKRQLALEGNLGDRRQLAVAARNAEHVGASFGCKRSRIVALTEDAGLDFPRSRRGKQLIRARPALPRARVDQEEARQTGKSIGPMAS